MVAESAPSFNRWPRDRPACYTPGVLRTLLENELLICPACRGAPEGVFHHAPLRLDAVLREQKGRIEQGFMRCTGCGTRYPVLDGVAVIFRDMASAMRGAERAAMWRADLDPELERWLRGAWTDEEDPNWQRQMLAIYGRALDPGEKPSPAMLRYEERRRALLAGLSDPLVLDAGCGVGASSLSAAALGARVLAMDADLGALRALSRLLTEGRIRLPRWRHGGGDFVTVDIEITPDVDPSRLALVASDALDPPIRARSFDLVLAYHLLDNVARPVQLLRQLHAGLRPGGVLAVASPYDWSPRATPVAERLGEHIRAGEDPDPAAALRALLSGELPALAPELKMEILLDEPALEWTLQRHDRSAHTYRTHYVEAARRAA